MAASNIKKVFNFQRFFLWLAFCLQHVTLQIIQILFASNGDWKESIFRQNVSFARLKFVKRGSAFTWLGLSEIRQIQLHGFGDTSSKAYAAVIYLRFILIDGSIFTSLVPSKTKVIPGKRQKLSFPHLGLLACLLLTKLLKNVLCSLNFVYTDIKLYCWTDLTDCVFG